MKQYNNFAMKLITASSVALWMLVGFASCASLKDSERSIVKRDVEIIPAIFSGAVDMTLDLLDRFGKGFAVRGSSKTDVDALGLHDEKKFETGVGEAIVPQEREKRSAAPCNGKNNSTGTRNNTRNASNSDAETLARRKRSVQSIEPSDRIETEIDARSKRSAQGQNNDFPQGSNQNGGRPQQQGDPNWNQNRYPNEHQNRDNDNRNGNGQNQGQNMQNGQQNLNGYGSNPGENFQNQNSRLKKRSAKPCNGNGQPVGAPTNNVPSQQLPQQSQQSPQQSQPQPAGGVNINDLQRDQNQRRRRGVNDPDKVLPTSSGEDKNLFDRVVEVAKEIVARITKWGQEMDNGQLAAAAADPKSPK